MVTGWLRRSGEHALASVCTALDPTQSQPRRRRRASVGRAWYSCGCYTALAITVTLYSSDSVVCWEPLACDYPAQTDNAPGILRILEPSESSARRDSSA